MSMTSNETTAVPDAITKYQAAHDSRDVATALAQFTVDACVIDIQMIWSVIVEEICNSTRPDRHF